MFRRGEVDPKRLGKEAKIEELAPDNIRLLRKRVGDFCAYFGFDLAEILKKSFTKVYSSSHRPYGTIYAS
jgi:hypothetical protein